MEHLFLHIQLLALDTDQILAAYGLPAIFVVMLLKEAGVPIPIPGDLIMLGAAARAAAGQFDVVAMILTFEVAMLLGGIVQYLLARGPGRGLVYRFGRYIGLTQPRLDRAVGTLQCGGVAGVTVAVMTPGVRAASVAAAGLANLPLATFIPGLLVGNTVFFLLHLALGYAGGQGFSSLFQATGLPAGPTIVIVVVAVLVLGFVGWMLLRRRSRRMHDSAAESPLAETAGAWEEACCPACLALAAVRQARSGAVFVPAE